MKRRALPWGASVWLALAAACSGATDSDPIDAAADVSVHELPDAGKGGTSNVPPDASLDAPSFEDVSVTFDAPSDGSGDGNNGDAGVIDASVDSDVEDADASGNVIDATPAVLPDFCEPLDDVIPACGTAQCSSPWLEYPSIADGACCARRPSCNHGCVSYPGGACCKKAPPECESGSEYAPGVECSFAAKGLCFATLEQACACAACGSGKICASPPPDPLVTPKIKLPKKLLALPSCPPEPPTDASTSPPTSAQFVGCHAPSDAAPIDAAPSDAMTADAPGD